MGYWAAKFFSDAGARIVAIGEYPFSVTNPAGIDVDDLHNYRVKNKGSFQGYSKGSVSAGSAHVLEVDCDILIPAALERQIHYANAPNIKAKLIGEAANGPVTPRADEILLKNNKVVIPDMLLNAGGVTGEKRTFTWFFGVLKRFSSVLL